MAFTAKDVKALRDKTGCGMMDCKKALTEANGDMDKAIDFLREQGLAKQAQKADRIAAEGVAFAVTSEDRSKGAIIEVNAETDFVAKNKDFIAFVETCANTVLNENPADIEALMELKAEGSDMTISEMLQDKVATIGENIQIRRFARFEGACVSYVHAGGTIGVIVNFDTDLISKPEFVVYGRDVAMQIAALNTPYLNREDVPEDVLEHEKKVMREQAINEGKPDHIADKIVLGRINKFYQDNCLLDQNFVKDNDITIKQYTEKTAKELGGNIKILDYVRYERGEGIEKREDDLASEVAEMIK